MPSLEVTEDDYRLVLRSRSAGAEQYTYRTSSAGCTRLVKVLDVDFEVGTLHRSRVQH